MNSAYEFLLWSLLGLLWWFFVDVYYKYRLDVYRQSLFEIRDTLFEEAAKEDLFDRKAYTMTRITLNGMIRFAHQVSFLHFLISYVSYRWFVKRDIASLYMDDFASALGALPEDQQRVIARARIHAHMVLANHVLRTSIVLLPLFQISYFLLRVSRMASKVIDWLFEDKKHRAQWAFIDAEAYEVGTPMSPSDSNGYCAIKG